MTSEQSVRLSICIEVITALNMARLLGDSLCRDFAKRLSCLTSMVVQEDDLVGVGIFGVVGGVGG